MWAGAAAFVAMTLTSAPARDRVLVCRPGIAGDPALARGEAVAEAVRDRAEPLLDYGVPCDSTGEAARAARRAGLSHAVQVTAEGKTEGSLFELTVVDVDGRVVEVRRVAVPPGSAAVRPIGASLDALVAELRRPQTRERHRRAALGVVAGGLVLIAAGVVAASFARDEAARANAAVTPDEYLGAKRAWERNRGWSGAALGLGGAALAAGIVWRLDLGREE